MIPIKQTKEIELSSPCKILVITSCTKAKVFPSHLPKPPLVQAGELWDEKDDDRTLRDFGELEGYRLPAAQLYRGSQHRELMRGVELLRRTFGQEAVEVKIISAGFGVVDEHQWLPPYDASFADLSPSKIAAVSQRLRIPQTINALISDPYDYAFVLLGKSYLLSLILPFNAAPRFPCFFLACPSDRTIPGQHPYYHVPVGKNESIAFRFNQIGLKGHLFRLFAEQIILQSMGGEN